MPTLELAWYEELAADARRASDEDGTSWPQGPRPAIRRSRPDERQEPRGIAARCAAGR